MSLPGAFQHLYLTLRSSKRKSCRLERCQTQSQGLQQHEGPHGSLPHPSGHPDLPLSRERGACPHWLGVMETNGTV